MSLRDKTELLDVELLVALVASGAATTDEYEALLQAAAQQPSVLQDLANARAALTDMAVLSSEPRHVDLPEDAQFAAIAAKYERDAVSDGDAAQSAVAVAAGAGKAATPANSSAPRISVTKWAAASAAMATLAVAITWIVGQQRLQTAEDTHHQIASGLQVRCALAESDRTAAQSHAASRESLLAVMSSPSSVLATAKNEKGAELRVFFNQAQGKWVVAPANLAALPTDKDYQLWLITDSGAPIPAGLLPQDGSPVLLALPSDARLTNPKAITAALSVEPRGGSASPTMDQIVLMGKVI